jgi:osmoprotectant transport system ATP-binding protein
MIKVSNVSKQFGAVQAVNNISFEVGEGETLILLGTSGCGKTTTLRMLNRLIEPDKGEISINGQSILQQSPEILRRNIGYVLQHNALFPHYTVAQNIAIVPQLLKWDKEKIRQRTLDLMEKLHLPGEYLQAYPNQLSGGQQQRVNVARALAADPPILLMDEPFGALDPVTRANIVKEFKELEELQRKSIVMVTHDVQEAFELGDRICLMDKGSIMQIGKPEELLFHPANDFVKTFLEKQYLQLAWRSLTLDHIWPQLKNIDGHENGNLVSSNTSLWALMELMGQDGKNEPFAVQHNDNGERKQIRQDELLSLFNQYKNTKA